MEAKTNYARVGITVIILTTALIMSALWLSIGFGNKKYHHYIVYMHEAVSGLNEDSQVKYNGVQVGSVSKIEISKINPQLVILTLNVAEGTPITTSTTATLISQGITGATFVGLAAANPDLTPMPKKPSEPYPVIPSRPSMYNQFDRILKELSSNVSVLSERLKKIISDKNAQNIEKSLANIKSFTQVLKDHDKEIGRSLINADILLKNFAESSKEFPALIDKFSNQTFPPIIQLLNQMSSIATNLEALSVNLRQNPSIIIRGSAPPPPGPGEK